MDKSLVEVMTEEIDKEDAIDELIEAYGEDGYVMMKAHFEVAKCDLYEDVEDVKYYWQRFENVQEWCDRWLEVDEPQIMEFDQVNNNMAIISLPGNAFICFMG